MSEKRYTKNPFIEGMEIAVGAKRVQVSSLGKDQNIVINQATGEVSGTQIVARKKVDTAKFVKTFADYMAFTFELTKAGNKALRVVMWEVKERVVGRDVVTLGRFTLEDFLEAHEDSEPPLVLSYSTFARGLGELEKANIIAKARKKGEYYINPDCIFNGDRIAFTALLEREEVEKVQQFDLLE